MKKSYKKSYRRKPKIPFYKKSFFWKLLAFVVLFFVLIYVTVFCEFFWIKNINISGNELVDQKRVLDVVNNSINAKSIFLVNRVIIKDNILNEFPEVYLVNVRRDFPGTLIVNVIERNAIATWCDSSLESCFLIDKDGFLFKKTEPKNMVLISSNGSFDLEDTAIDPERLSELNNLWQEIKDVGVYWFEINGSEIIAHTFDNWDIKLTFNNLLSSQARVLRIILEEGIIEEDLEYIDVRFENRAYLKSSTQGS